jgi:beta-glucosidase/6-phospho-beta-glucosidase/beta-galactosidase
MRPDRRLNQAKDGPPSLLRATPLQIHQKPTAAQDMAAPHAEVYFRRSTDVPLTSFWMGGFDGADHINSSGVALSMTELTQHDSHVDDDYRRLADFEIRTVRESASWRIIERNGRYDFSSLQTRVTGAKRLGMQTLWTLLSSGWPAGIDPLSARFVDRFARYAKAVAEFLADYAHGVPIYTPINEISFISWAIGHSGHINAGNDYLKHRKGELRRQFVRAALAACDAIRSVDPRARFMHTDPLMHVVPPRRHRDLASLAAYLDEEQYCAWDMLCGKREPELGGDPAYMDVVGVNYYQTNQWELGTGQVLDWRLDDPRREPLATMLERVYQRYRRPLIIAETSHVGIGRGPWIREVTDEVATARQRGTPVHGICLYPVIDRPDWENLTHWHHSGLWDIEVARDGSCERRLNESYALALRDAQRTLNDDHLSRLSSPPRVIRPASPIRQLN